MNFRTPVAITANTPYVASYHDPAGHFALDRPYFTTSHDNPPLHALADVAGAPNGVYHQKPGFPNAGSQQSNYWVDVVFTTSTADNAPPASTVTFPAASGTYNVAGWNAGCATAGFCGTATDAVSGVKKVELSIQQGNGNYWNGTSFGSATETFLMATGTSSWSYPFPVASFASDRTYTIRVRATDNAGNVESASSRTFTIDTSLPAASNTFPTASGAYNATTWVAGCVSAGFCGTASDTGSGLRKVELSIRRGTGNYFNGTSFGSASEVWLAGTGTSSWSYAVRRHELPRRGKLHPPRPCDRQRRQRVDTDVDDLRLRRDRSEDHRHVPRRVRLVYDCDVERRLPVTGDLRDNDRRRVGHPVRRDLDPARHRQLLERHLVLERHRGLPLGVRDDQLELRVPRIEPRDEGQLYDPRSRDRQRRQHRDPSVEEVQLHAVSRLPRHRDPRPGPTSARPGPSRPASPASPGTSGYGGAGRAAA